MLVVGSVARVLGHDTRDVALSRSKPQRVRITTREMNAISEQPSFSPDDPLLHADVKLLSDVTDTPAARRSSIIFGNVGNFLVTRGEMVQLLAFHKIG